MANKQDVGTTIGMGTIKRRRLQLPVPCHSGTYVGEYVPFYFCSRSIMLYVIHRANHSELEYRGGQMPIVHLEADLETVIKWADNNERRWAFSLSNASARYTEFRSDISQLGDVNWSAVATRDFRSDEVNEGKQAEFLVHEFFPWELVDRVGVIRRDIAQRVADAMSNAMHRPVIEIKRNWYF